MSTLEDSIIKAQIDLLVKANQIVEDAKLSLLSPIRESLLRDNTVNVYGIEIRKIDEPKVELTFCVHGIAYAKWFSLYLTWKQILSRPSSLTAIDEDALNTANSVLERIAANSEEYFRVKSRDIMQERIANERSLLKLLPDSLYKENTVP